MNIPSRVCRVMGLSLGFAGLASSYCFSRCNISI
jgi:hypothetical protein